MKIAISATKGMVAVNFRDAQNFEIYDTLTKNREYVDNSFNGHRFVADYMSIKNIDAVIGSNMGIDLYNDLTSYGIIVYNGKCMDSDKAIEKLMNNELALLEPEEQFDDGNCGGCSCCN